MTKKISARRVVITSFFVDVLDIALNLAVMTITGSVVMLAELFQGVADLISSGFLLVGLRRSRKEIYFWTLSSALSMLLLASTLSFYFGLQRFLQPKAIENILLAYAALLFAACSNGYAFYVSAKRILDGRKPSALARTFASSSRIMTKNTFVLDLMGMSAALVGFIALILYQFVGERRFDGLGAMGIGVVLAFLSIDLILDIRKMRRKKDNTEDL
jgi:divalent metal cation (Fe/Co/Zn/Cd) transporter